MAGKCAHHLELKETGRFGRPPFVLLVYLLIAGADSSLV